MGIISRYENYGNTATGNSHCDNQHIEICYSAIRLGGCCTTSRKELLHAIGSTFNLSPTPYIVCIHILVGVVQQPPG